MQHPTKDLLKGLSAARIAALAAPKPARPSPPDPRPPEPPKPGKETRRRRGSPLPMFQPRVPQEHIDAIRREREEGARVIDLAAKYKITAAYVSMLTYGLRRASGLEGGAQ